MNGASPSHAQSQVGGTHRHARSEMNGQLYTQGLSPYGHQHAQSHDHGHSHSRSTESTYTLKPFATARPKGRPRGESDLGRPGGSKSAAAKQAFSPIHEHPAAFPPQSYVHRARRQWQCANWQPARGLNSPKRSQPSSCLYLTSLRRLHTSALYHRLADRLRLWQMQWPTLMLKTTRVADNCSMHVRFRLRHCCSWVSYPSSARRQTNR